MADQQGNSGWQAQPHDLPPVPGALDYRPALSQRDDPIEHQAPQKVLAASPPISAADIYQVSQ
jgi:hypothetical protein